MSLKSRIQALWKDESAQGATEYILILVAVVVVAAIFKNKIKDFVNDRLTNIGGAMGGFDANNTGGG